MARRTRVKNHEWALREGSVEEMAGDEQDRTDRKDAEVKMNGEQEKPVLLPKRPERPERPTGLTLFSKTRDLELARGGKMKPSRSERPKSLTLSSKPRDVKAASGGEGEQRDSDATTLFSRHASVKDRGSVKPTLQRRSSLREQENPRRSRSKRPDISVDVPTPLEVRRSSTIRFASPPRRSGIESSSDENSDEQEEQDHEGEAEANDYKWWNDHDSGDDEVVVSSVVAEVDETEQSASDFDDEDEDVAAQRYLNEHEDLLREAQEDERPKVREYLNTSPDRHRSWVRQRSQR
ncbi:MAG: hypothetical protein Q9181_004606 [Wetmoreana brouardii]